MNRHPKFPTSLFLICLCFFLGNCYFNPLVQPIVNPEVEESGNSFLPLLGLRGGDSNLVLTGQIRDANGVALTGLVLVTPGTSNNTKATLPTTTDSGGRFYIPYQSGRISLNVLQSGNYYFGLVLNVSNPNLITAETIDAPLGIEISSLGTIGADVTPNYFELVNSNPQHNSIRITYLPSIDLTFSEAPIPALATGPLVDAWISQNISITPVGSFDNVMNVSGNTLTIAFQSLSSPNVYEITLKPGILSATGKPLTQRVIRFSYQAPL